MAVSVLVGSPGELNCATNFGNIAVSNKHMYTVRMQTYVTIPTSRKSPCEEVRVWHALPTNRPWSQVPPPRGYLHVSSSPVGVVEAEPDKRSDHVYWDVERVFRPGERLQFISQFSVVSADRTFNPSGRTISWLAGDATFRKLAARLKEDDPEVIALARQLRGNHDPANTVREICKWVFENIKYNGLVRTDPADVSRTLQQKEGHCGHQMQVFNHLCAAAGLPSRTVTGISMRSPTGKSDQSDLADSEINIHVWAEVYIPGCGWVEVEPQNGENCFTVKAESIECNSAFQAYAVWVNERDQEPRQERCVYDKGAYRGDYKVIHLISFKDNPLSK